MVNVQIKDELTFSNFINHAFTLLNFIWKFKFWLNQTLLSNNYENHYNSKKTIVIIIETR